jgi:nucleoside-diphosphate-sugar epimerase
MYGSAGSLFVTEEASLAPLTPYAVSKVKTEEDLRSLAGDGFSPVYMRNATVYGVSPRLRADLVLNNLVLWAHTTGRIRILSDGSPWRPIIHVRDLTNAFIAVLDAPVKVIHNQAFNVGIDTENYQVRDLAEFVRESVPGCSIEYVEGGGPDPRSYRVDFSKICRQLPGFQPKWSARLGAGELYEAVQREGLTLADFHGRKYVRLNQVKYLVSKGLIDENFRWRN